MDHTIKNRSTEDKHFIVELSPVGLTIFIK